MTPNVGYSVSRNIFSMQNVQATEINSNNIELEYSIFFSNLVRQQLVPQGGVVL